MSDGTKLNLYESIEDVMYGLYLHADQNRILRMSHTKELLRFFCTKKYVEEIEIIVLELYDFLTKNNISCITETEHARAPVIHLGLPGASAQNIKLSPYWGNMYGSDATDEDVKSLFKNNTEEECVILLQVRFFLEELAKENVSISTLKNMVFESTLEQWGDFSETISLLKKIQKPGISNRVRFNNEKDVAYVRVLPNVEEIFIIFSPHVITDVYDVTLIKDKNANEWKIFAFGSPVDPFIRN